MWTNVSPWLPEMKALAGGVDDLQEPGAPAERLRWEQVLSYAPEVLILAPCVAWSPEQTLAELDRLAAQPGWWALPAVRHREVYIVHHVLFSRAGPRLVNGRGLHSFPFPLNLSLLCPFPLDLSLLCPPNNPSQPVDVSQGAQVEL
jgi:hypothetical protein